MLRAVYYADACTEGCMLVCGRWLLVNVDCGGMVGGKSM